MKHAFTPNIGQYGKSVLLKKEGESLNILLVSASGYNHEVCLDIGVVNEFVVSILQCYTESMSKGFVSSGCIHSISMSNGRILEINGNEPCIEILELDCQDSDSECEEIDNVNILLEDIPALASSIELLVNQ